MTDWLEERKDDDDNVKKKNGGRHSPPHTLSFMCVFTAHNAMAKMVLLNKPFSLERGGRWEVYLDEKRKMQQVWS